MTQVDVDVVGRGLGDERSVAQDDDTVGDLERLFEMVGDVDDRHAARGQLADDAEQHLDLGHAERRRRLVHDQHARVLRQRAGDLDDLLLADAQVADRASRSRAAPRGAPAAVAVISRWRCWSTITPPRMRSRAMKTLSAMLRFGKRLSSWWMIAMPRSAASRGPLISTGSSVELERAGGGRLDPGEDLHERRLAGAVLAEQRGDLARDDVEVDAAQRVRGAEHLVDAARAHHRLGGDAHDAASSFTGVIVTTVGAR